MACAMTLCNDMSLKQSRRTFRHLRASRSGHRRRRRPRQPRVRPLRLQRLTDLPRQQVLSLLLPLHLRKRLPLAASGKEALSLLQQAARVVRSYCTYCAPFTLLYCMCLRRRPSRRYSRQPYWCTPVVNALHSLLRSTVCVYEGDPLAAVEGSHSGALLFYILCALYLAVLASVLRKCPSGRSQTAAFAQCCLSVLGCLRTSVQSQAVRAACALTLIAVAVPFFGALPRVQHAFCAASSCMVTLAILLACLCGSLSLYFRCNYKVCSNANLHIVSHRNLSIWLFMLLPECILPPVPLLVLEHGTQGAPSNLYGMG